MGRPRDERVALRYEHACRLPAPHAPRLQFKRSYKRNDKPVCLAAIKFIAHLANQQVRVWQHSCSTTADKAVPTAGQAELRAP